MMGGVDVAPVAATATFRASAGASQQEGMTMAEQRYDAFDAADSHDESATERAPQTPANTSSDTPAHNAASERAELASSTGVPKGKSNKHPVPPKAFEAETARDDVVDPQESEEILDAQAFVDYGTTPDEALVKLEAQGFTELEALRLLVVSDRDTHSKEAIESQETLRRLRFTRWLVERGLLSEYPA